MVSGKRSAAPPRPVAGDVVTGYSEVLGGWSAGHITHVDAGERLIAVLELDWVGEQPGTLDDVRDARPVYAAQGLAHVRCPWQLPRGVQVVGSMPVPAVAAVMPRSFSYWRLGTDVAHARWRAAGNRGSLPMPSRLAVTPGELEEVLAGPARADVRQLHVTEIADLDCIPVVEHFPELRHLDLAGDLGILRNSARLNDSGHLTEVSLSNLFGMTAQDCLLPDSVPHLESLSLDSVPADYAEETRRLWRREVRHGTLLEVRGARPPGWVEENRANPLRVWDGRPHISARTYARAIAQFRLTRDAIVTTLRETPREEWVGAMPALAHDLAEGMNRTNARTGFIETEERQELYLALQAIFDSAQTELATDTTEAWNTFADVVDARSRW